MRRLKTILGSLAAVALASGPALANSEVITTFDARSSGMAHTGTAFIDSPAAIFANPANLTEIKKLDVTLHLSPDLTSARVPYYSVTNATAAPDIANKQSQFLFTPLGFFGVGFKLHPQMTVGLAAQLSAVKGVNFTDTSMTLVASEAAQLPTLATLAGSATAGQLFWEVRAPIAVDINKYLTVAAGYRMGFYHQFLHVDAHSVAGGASIPLQRQSYHGQNFAGAQAGITLRATKDLRFGLTYRSKLIVNGKGHVDQFNTATSSVVSTPATQHYASPHMFTFGFAYSALAKRLTVAGDYKYWMYKDAYGGRAYRDAMSGHIGAEYMVTPHVPLRAGYLIGLSAVKKNLAQPFDTTPGLQHGGTIGSGYHFKNVDLDGAVGVGGSNTQISQQTTAINGNYKLYAVLINLSATYHL